MMHADTDKLLVKLLGEQRETNRLLRLMVGEREPVKPKSEGGVSTVRVEPGKGVHVTGDTNTPPSQLTSDQAMLAAANPRGADVVHEAGRVLRLTPEQLRSFRR